MKTNFDNYTIACDFATTVPTDKATICFWENWGPKIGFVLVSSAELKTREHPYNMEDFSYDLDISKPA